MASHKDVKQDKAMVKKMVKKDALKGMKCGGKVQKMAAGGAAKVRKGFPMTKGKPGKK